MNSKQIEISYRNIQVDVYTIVRVKDHFDKEHEECFETDTEANNYVDNLPADYYVIDKRLNNDRRYWVSDFRKERYNLD